MAIDIEGSGASSRREPPLAARDLDERLSLALAVGAMGIWEYDLPTGRLRLSPELEAIHGLAPGVFDGSLDSARAFVHPEDLSGLTTAVVNAVERRSDFTHEFRAIRPDGAVQHLRSRAKVTYDESGEARAMLGVVMEITDRKVAGLELENKFAQLQLLFELAGAVSHADEPGEIYRAAVNGLTRAVGADRASMLIFDADDVLRFKAWVGVSEEYRAAVEGHSPWPRGSADAQPIAVPDVRLAPSLSAYRDVFAKEGIAAVAFIPLLGKGGLIGKFMVYYNQPHDFRTEELQVAQTIATHVAFAAERQNAGAALRASEERFRAIFAQAAVGIAQVSLDGKFLLPNGRLCDILGYTREELREKSFQDVTHPSDRAVAAEVARQLLAGEIPFHTREKRYLRKDGAIVWARLYASLVRGVGGAPDYFIAVIEDISGRVLAERALQDSERNLALAESAARMSVWDCDLRSGRTVISGEYARLHGLPPDHGPLTHAMWLELIHPDDRERVQALLRETLEQTHIWDAEFRVVWPDGSVHWLLGQGKVSLDDSGAPVRFAGVSLDITERKQAESALLESEERFRNMADTAPVMIWVAGVDKVLTFFNKTWLDFVGRTLEQESNNGWVASVHPDDLDRCFASYSAAFDARKRFDVEYRFRRADGEYRRVLCSGAPRFAPGGVFAGYIGSDIDITELRIAQEEAFEKQKLESLGVLTSGIAHDFNNLLGSILVDAELAESDLAEGGSPGEHIRRIKAVAVSAAEIVRELMIYSGQDKADLGPVDLSRLVEEMLELLKVSISKRAVLKTHFSKNLPAVRGNAAQIRQIAMNLILNASEALDRDGVIEISTSLAADHVLLKVSDTGCGMTDEQKARVFDPFFTTKFAGRGLGLAVVQGIVRAHRGAIQLTSAPGQGTSFEVLLPCADRLPEPQRTAAVPDSSEPAAGAAGVVLVVEDEEMLRVSVSKMLRKRGFFVVEAGDGSAAVDILWSHRGRIDALLLDVTIPGSSSKEVMAEARRLQPDIKVILTSAYSREMVVPSGDAPPISAFIRKPFSLADLVVLLRKILGPGSI